MDSILGTAFLGITFVLSLASPKLPNCLVELSFAMYSQRLHLCCARNQYVYVILIGCQNCRTYWRLARAFDGVEIIRRMRISPDWAIDDVHKAWVIWV